MHNKLQTSLEKEWSDSTVIYNTAERGIEMIGYCQAASSNIFMPISCGNCYKQFRSDMGSELGDMAVSSLENFDNKTQKINIPDCSERRRGNHEHIKSTKWGNWVTKGICVNRLSKPLKLLTRRNKAIINGWRKQRQGCNSRKVAGLSNCKIYINYVLRRRRLNELSLIRYRRLLRTYFI